MSKITDLIEKANKNIKFYALTENGICNCNTPGHINKKELLEDILPDLHSIQSEQQEMIDMLIKLYKINQNINKFIAEHNHRTKCKIGLNFLDLMNEIEIKKFIEKITGKPFGKE